MLQTVLLNGPRFVVSVPREVLPSKSSPKPLRVNSLGSRHFNCRNQSFPHRLGLLVPLADHTAQGFDIGRFMLDDHFRAEPFGAGFEPVALVAVTGTLFGTLVVLTVKLLTRTEGTMTIMFYFSIWTTVLSAIPAFVMWVQPSGTELALLVLTGLLGIVGQAMFTHGIGTGETTMVMPFDYLRIIYASLIGMVVFAEVPGPWSIAGAAVIMASSLYIVRTQGKRKDGG